MATVANTLLQTICRHIRIAPTLHPTLHALLRRDRRLPPCTVLPGWLSTDTLCRRFPRRRLERMRLCVICFRRVVSRRSGEKPIVAVIDLNGRLDFLLPMALQGLCITHVPMVPRPQGLRSIQRDHPTSGAVACVGVRPVEMPSACSLPLR